MANGTGWRWAHGLAIPISKSLHDLAPAKTMIVMEIIFPKISKTIYEQTTNIIGKNL